MKPEKVKNVLTNHYFILFIITLLALFIRLLNIDKPLGLWYDEMLTYIVSSKSLPLGILKMILKEDYHMPLYYFYVNIWMKFFGSNDVVLRYSSVLWGVMSVPAFYYLGKTYRSKSLGYFLSIVACLSPVMIYYSQEFRFYSMLIFFATVSMIFFLRLIDLPSKKDFLIFFISNLIILYIYTMGILFVSLEIFLLIFHYYFYKKDFFVTFIKYTAIFFILSIPYFYLLFSYLIASSQALIDPLYFTRINIYSPFIVINDLFSPFLTTPYSNSPMIYISFYKILATRLALFFLSTSTICFLIGFISSFRDFNKKFVYVLAIPSAFLLIEMFLCFGQSFVLFTRYVLVILPILLLICCDGLLLIKTNFWRRTFIGLIFLIFIYNSINYKNMPAFSFRNNGYKSPASELIKLNLDKNDYILYPSRSEFFKKYLNNVNFIDFSTPNITYLDRSKKESLKVFDKEFVLSTNKHNSMDKLIPYFLDSKPTPQLTQFMNDSLKKIPKGNRLIFVDNINDNVNADLISNLIRKYQNNQISSAEYKEALFSLFYARIHIDIKNILDNNPSLKAISHEYGFTENKKTKKWDFYVYQKQ